MTTVRCPIVACLGLAAVVASASGVAAPGACVPALVVSSVILLADMVWWLSALSCPPRAATDAVVVAADLLLMLGAYAAGHPVLTSLAVARFSIDVVWWLRTVHRDLAAVEAVAR